MNHLKSAGFSEKLRISSCEGVAETSVKPIIDKEVLRKRGIESRGWVVPEALKSVRRFKNAGNSPFMSSRKRACSESDIVKTMTNFPTFLKMATYVLDSIAV